MAADRLVCLARLSAAERPHCVSLADQLAAMSWFGRGCPAGSQCCRVSLSYVYAREKCGEVPAGLQVPPGDLAAELKAFLAVHGDKAVFVLYPDRDEFQSQALMQAHFAAGRALLAATRARTVQVAADRRWKTAYYKDGIHPTAQGNRVLAAVLGDVSAAR